MTILWLIRHGQTDWNIEGRYQGQADVPLNATGVEQVHRLTAQLKGEHFDAFFSSDLLRARQTAAILAAEVGMTPQLDRRLREIHQGDWEGLLMSDIVSRYNKEFHNRRRDPEKARAPSGESVLEVSLRMTGAVDDIAHIFPSGKIAVVSHGLAIATVIAKAKELPLEEVYSLIPDNAIVQVVEWHVNGRTHYTT
jgi:broad specificity phosphatase PhoE